MTSGWRVPGRIEVLGKHTDYAGGDVLVCAVNQAVTATGTPRTDASVVARSSAFAEPVTLQPGAGETLPRGHWGRYLQVVVDRFTHVFGPLPGVDLELSSTLPLASGMSSSSALLVASALTWADSVGLPGTPAWHDLVGDCRLRLASFLASVENGRGFGELDAHAGVGTLGGSEDHLAMLCAEDGKLTHFGFAPTAERRRVRWPKGWTFVVATSGVAAEKTGAAQALYNRASLATAEILRRWQEETGRTDATLADAVRSDRDAVARLIGLISDDDYLQRRLTQFVGESERLVPAAVEALAAGDLAGFGAIAAESQHIADTQLGNQVPQTNRLAALATELGAAAATSFGAGFGGSVWALVADQDAEGLASDWVARYRSEFPDEGAKASCLFTKPASPARRF